MTPHRFCLNEEDQKGQDGTSITPKGQLTSSANLPTTAQKGDSYIIDGFLWVYTGANTTGAVRGFVNAGSIKGPAGASSYVHIAYANSADGTIDFTTKDNADGGKTYLFVGFVWIQIPPTQQTLISISGRLSQQNLYGQIYCIKQALRRGASTIGRQGKHSQIQK